MLQTYKKNSRKNTLKRAFLTFWALLSIHTSIFAQDNQRITIQQKRMTVIEALKTVEKQSKMRINYSNSQLKGKDIANLDLKNISVSAALDKILMDTGFTYQIQGNYIIIAEKKNKMDQAAKIIKGKVTDESNEPLIGVNISVAGNASVGTITDLDGNFTLKVPANATLKISFIGYSTLSVPVSQKEFYLISMKQDAKALDEVVVTALGIKRSEKALSYNVQQLKGDELTAIKDANFISSLTGKVAGVTINSSATTGGASRVVMRGVKSITSSNLALYVIDGVPMYNMMNGGGGHIFSSQPGTDGVADINPEDIESISMLTGPSAAALYGNAAASGVVLITTKKGSADKTSIMVSNNTTFSTVNMMPKMQSKYGNLPNVLDSWGTVVNSSYNPRDFFQTGANIINTVSVSTGNKKNQTYVSASTTNTTNILPNSKYNRYNFTARNTTSFWNDKMMFDISANYILQNDLNMVSQGFYDNPLPGLYRFPRSENFDDVRMYERYNKALNIMERYWPYGGEVSEGTTNPYWMQYRQLRENKKSRYMLTASLKYQMLDWLDITGRVKINNYENRATHKSYASTGNLKSGDRGGYSDIWSKSNETYADLIATVNKNTDNWSVNINMGASLNDTRYEMMGYAGGLKIFNLFAIHNIQFREAWKPKQDGWHDQAQAIFSNAELGWKSMLYFTLTGRNDWDSRLAFSRYPSFFYYSGGVSALLSSMFKMPEWVSYLKVRGSYSEVGSPYGRFMTTVSYPFDEQSHTWTSTTVYPNTDLKPERTHSWEAGIDARLFNDFSLNLTWYRSNTFNQTFHSKLSESSGYTSLPIQSGDIMNTGVELALGFNKKWGDFSFSTNYTFTYNKNEVKRLDDGVLNFVTGKPIERKELNMQNYPVLDAQLLLRVGGSMGDVYGKRVLKRDLNGYILNDTDTGLAMEQKEVYLGSILPKMNMGWRLGFGYKGVNLGMTFAARIGGVAMSATQSILDAAGVSQTSADARDAGGIRINQSMVSAQTYYQKIAGTAAYYTYSATNIRLGEVTLGYTLPRKWFNDKVGMTVGVVGKNLWMIYCKAPFDPELTSTAGSNYYQGFDAYMLPSTKSLGFNVKLQF